MIALPKVTAQQQVLWEALFQVYSAMPEGWTLIGGQMVQLHCVERGATGSRQTFDADTVVDIRADKNSLTTFTDALYSIGFRSAGVSMEGHEHRWVLSGAQVDVLVAGGLGPRLERAAKTVTGSTTLATPGAQQALDRTEVVAVRCGESTGHIRRPSLLGALVVKAAAWQAKGATARHLADMATLAKLAKPSDRLAELATPRDKHYLRLAFANAVKHRPIAADDDAMAALRALDRALGTDVIQAW
ncbi:MAG: hypothetical protein LBQ92_05575 [Propionibacteriaceae bacterium]|jgi:hypothetical protein|nr:hypothetical protein [Propionibacteriaceae bacterium]